MIKKPLGALLLAMFPLGGLFGFVPVMVGLSSHQAIAQIIPAEGHDGSTGAPKQPAASGTVVPPVVVQDKPIVTVPSDQATPPAALPPKAAATGEAKPAQAKPQAAAKASGKQEVLPWTVQGAPIAAPPANGVTANAPTDPAAAGPAPAPGGAQLPATAAAGVPPVSEAALAKCQDVAEAPCRDLKADCAWVADARLEDGTVYPARCVVRPPAPPKAASKAPSKPKATSSPAASAGAAAVKKEEGKPKAENSTGAGSAKPEAELAKQDTSNQPPLDKPIEVKPPMAAETTPPPATQPTTATTPVAAPAAVPAAPAAVPPPAKAEAPAPASDGAAPPPAAAKAAEAKKAAEGTQSKFPTGFGQVNPSAIAPVDNSVTFKMPVPK